MNRFFEAVFLFLVLVVLTYSSEVWILGIVAFFALLKFALNHYRKKVPLYLKSVAYLAIVPFAFWWVLSPSVERGFSPWLLIIPSWYFMFLALWQWRGLHRGGFPVFVFWNGLFVLLLSLRTHDQFQLVLMGLAFLAFILSVKTPRQNVRFAISLTLSILLGFGLFFGAKKLYEWRQGRFHASNYHDSYSKNRLMGFSPFSSLGSFQSNYIGEQNSEIVFRVFSKKKPLYFRGLAYTKYSAGRWHHKQSGEWVLPNRYIGDYAVFESEDTLTDSVWVQSAINTHGYFFAPMNVGVAVEAADSITMYDGRIFYNESVNHRDWYYVEGKSKIGRDLSAEAFLNFPTRLDSLFALAEQEIGISDSVSLQELTNKIRKFFFEKFEYTLVMPSDLGREPLETFWKIKKGYCEYFATMATLLLRHKGIPARYVVGFSSPVLSPSEDYYLFFRRNAHAWVEYFDGSQWVIFDPTPGGGESILLENAELSAWQENFKVAGMKILHFLKNGEWRRSLDAWTLFLEKLLRSVFFWSFVIVIFGVYGIHRYQIKKRNLVKESISEYVILWRKKLKKTERILSRFGLVRMPGETVGAFVLRIELYKPSEKQMKRFNAALSVLREYEKERWKKV